jgi:DNA-binding XRE family transcriptional regulator
MAFPENFRMLMGAHQVEQSEFANALGLSKQGVWQLASGRNGPSLMTASKIAGQFAVTVDLLMWGSQRDCLIAAAESYDIAPIRTFLARREGSPPGAKKPARPKTRSTQTA